MRIAIGFEKRGPVRFVSHLDLQRAVQRALRRANLPLAYTQGFNPHPQISLASALAVGTESREEWLEAQLTDVLPLETIREALDGVLPPGLALTRVVELPDAGKALMALVGRVEYAVSPLPGWTQAELDVFLAQERILVEKRSKKGMATVDIRPLVLELAITDATLNMRLTHGEGWSIRPELVMEALCRFTGHPAESFRICRLAMYAGREGELIPLIDAAKEEKL